MMSPVPTINRTPPCPIRAVAYVILITAYAVAYARCLGKEPHLGYTAVLGYLGIHFEDKHEKRSAICKDNTYLFHYPI